MRALVGQTESEFKQFLVPLDRVEAHEMLAETAPNMCGCCHCYDVKIETRHLWNTKASLAYSRSVFLSANLMSGVKPAAQGLFAVADESTDVESVGWVDSSHEIVDTNHQCYP